MVKNGVCKMHVDETLGSSCLNIEVQIACMQVFENLLLYISDVCTFQKGEVYIFECAHVINIIIKWVKLL